MSFNICLKDNIKKDKNLKNGTFEDTKGLFKCIYNRFCENLVLRQKFIQEIKEKHADAQCSYVCKA